MLIGRCRQCVQRLTEARAKYTETVIGPKQGTMGEAHDVLAIAGHETILAIVHGHVQVRTKISVNSHLPLPAQSEHGIAAVVPRIETKRAALLKFRFVAKKCPVLQQRCTSESKIYT